MTNWIVHVLLRKCLLKHVIEGDVEGTGTRGRRRKQLLDDLQKNIIYLNFRASTISQSVNNSVWSWLWSCRKEQYVMIQFTSFRWMLMPCRLNNTSASYKAGIRTQMQYKNNRNTKTRQHETKQKTINIATVRTQRYQSSTGGGA